MTVFEASCVAIGLQPPIPEFCFSPPRKWRFDFCWPGKMVALEKEGGAYRGHGHRSVGRFLRDMEKYNAAACLGWRVLRCTVDEFENGSVLALLLKAMPLEDLEP